MALLNFKTRDRIYIMISISIMFIFVDCGDNENTLNLYTYTLIDRNLERNYEIDIKNLSSAIGDSVDRFYSNHFDIGINNKKTIFFDSDNIEDFLKLLDINRYTILIFYRDGKGNDSGYTYSNVPVKQINLSISPNIQHVISYQYIFIHEIAHLFSAVDITCENTIMNAKTFLDYIRDPETDFVKHTVAKDLNQQNNIPFDSLSTKLIKISKEQFIKKQGLLDIHEFEVASFRDIQEIYMELREDSLNPDKLYFYIATYYLKINDFNSALDYYKYGMELYTKNNSVVSDVSPFSEEDFFYKLAICLMNLNRLDEAIPYWQKIKDEGLYGKKKYSMFPSLYARSVSTLYLSNGDKKRAIDLLKKASEKGLMNQHSWKLLGIFQFSTTPLKQWYNPILEEAELALKKAEQLGNRSQDLYLYLAAICLGQDNLIEAKKYLNQLEESYYINKKIEKGEGYFYINKNYEIVHSQ